MSALTDKLKKRAKALIPRFYREYKGASDWWHSIKVGGKYYDFNFLTHDPDGTGEFPAKLRNAVKVVAYKVVEDKDGGLRQSDRGLIRLGYFNGRIKFGNRMYKSRLKINPPAPAGDYNSPEVSIVYKAKYSELGWQGSGGSVEKFANSLGGRGTGGGTDMRTGLRDKSFKFKTIAGAVKFAAKMKPYALRISAERYNHDTMKREKLPIGKSR